MKQHKGKLGEFDKGYWVGYKEGYKTAIYKKTERIVKLVKEITKDKNLRKMWIGFLVSAMEYNEITTEDLPTVQREILR